MVNSNSEYVGANVGVKDLGCVENVELMMHESTSTQ